MKQCGKLTETEGAEKGRQTRAARLHHDHVYCVRGLSRELSVSMAPPVPHSGVQAFQSCSKQCDHSEILNAWHDAQLNHGRQHYHCLQWRRMKRLGVLVKTAHGVGGRDGGVAVYPSLVVPPVVFHSKHLEADKALASKIQQHSSTHDAAQHTHLQGNPARAAPLHEFHFLSHWPGDGSAAEAPRLA